MHGTIRLFDQLRSKQRPTNTRFETAVRRLAKAHTEGHSTNVHTTHIRDRNPKTTVTIVM